MEKEKKPVCKWDHCSAEFETTDQMIPHLSNLHLISNHLSKKIVTQVENNDIKITKIEIPCKWQPCDKDFASVDQLLEHLSWSHLPLSTEALEKPNVCFWINCGDRFGDFESLTTHIAVVHVGEGLSEYTHTGDKPYQCTLCFQKFSGIAVQNNSIIEMAVMEQHQRTHTGEKPYACTEENCTKFSVSGALLTHSRTHTGEKPFQCKEAGCEKRFGDSSNLAKHTRTHLKVKPYKCPLDECEKSFARADQVNRHAKVHRGIGGKSTSGPAK
ncbi:zinc-finger protein [Globomyces sp. JEL0801]|nr:zinc-finger protein [Globomyces sp. JEL0801]